MANEWESASWVPNMATKEDRDYAWRHAFCYADRCPGLNTDDAADYANHYARIIAGEEDTNHWPAHSTVFCPWYTARLTNH